MEAETAGPPYRAPPPAPALLQRLGVRPWRVRELLGVVAVAALVDAAFYGRGRLGGGGLGLALLLFAVPAAVLVAARTWRSSPRLLATGALLCLVAVRSAVDPTVATTLAGLGLLAVWAVTLRGPHAFLPDAVRATFRASLTLPWRVLGAVAGAKRLATRGRTRRTSVWPVFVPVVLSGLFLAVFALANPLVARWLGAAWDVATELLVPSFGRALLWAVATAAALVLVRPSPALATGAEAAAPDGVTTPTSLLVARNTLVALNVLFVLYNVLDAACLWRGRPPEGMTTQGYAHAGAFWLTVALALLTAVVGVLFRGALAHAPAARLSRALAYAWVAQGGVLAVGTYRRIAIHVAHTGLSDLRIVGVLGTTSVVVGALLVARKLATRRSLRWLVRRQLDALAVTFVIYAVTPTHWLGARVNVTRILAGEYGPLLHVLPQSQHTESAAVMVSLLGHPDHRVREGVAAALVVERARLRAELTSERTWRERDLLAAQTLAALDAAAPRATAILHGVPTREARAALSALASAAADDVPRAELARMPGARTLVLTPTPYERSD